MLVFIRVCSLLILKVQFEGSTCAATFSVVSATLLLFWNTSAVVSTLRNFVRMFNQAHVENCRQLELETKKAAESENLKMGASHKESKQLLHTPIHSGNVKWSVIKWNIALSVWRISKCSSLTRTINLRF